MRVHVTHGQSLAGWTAWHPNDAVDGLPDTDIGEIIERIFVADLLALTDPEFLPVLMESWWDHPAVSQKTLLGFTVPRHDARRAYALLRPAGWGIACPYNTTLLILDKWPVAETTQRDGLVGGIGRAIKKTAPQTQR